VIIDWHFPTALEFSTYRIEIKAKDGEWYKELSECNGGDAQIAAANFCQVQVQTLLAPPFSLMYNDLVYARVYIIDEEGWKSMSAVQSL